MVNKNSPYITTAVALATILAAGSSCSNGRNLKSKTVAGSSAATSTTTTSGAFTLASIQESTDTAGSATLKITVQSQATALNSSAACGTTGADCGCRVDWNYKTNEGDVAVDRHIMGRITAITPTQVTCVMPATYKTESEIETGKELGVSIRRAADDSIRISNSVAFNKGTAMLNVLNQTSPLNDIARYTCSDSYIRHTAILSAVTKHTSATDAANTSFLAHSTRFCLPGDPQQDPQECADSNYVNPGTRTSNQRNPYNFYTRNSNLSATSQNGGFTCPEIVKGIETGTSNSLFPLDRSFSLSNTSGAEFFVPVEANIKVSGGGGDPSSTGLTCGTSANANPENSSTVVGCLGFAAKPSPTGACPDVTIGGVTKPTYRLRKYFAVFPPNFERDGSPMLRDGKPAPQNIDTVYVLDRPIYNTASSSIIGTVAGPKPCPFAYRDMNGVIDATSAYYSTNDPLWAGKNLDGIKLPGDGVARDSCSATFPSYTRPYTNAATLQFNLVSDSDDPYYIRPMQPWTLHYEEDTSFQACAPKAAVTVDPPIHALFSAENGAAYCTETLPTGFDVSPAVPNTMLGHDGISNGVGDHWISANNFGGGTPTPLPLLAFKKDIVAALTSDISYRCNTTSVIDPKYGLESGEKSQVPTCCAEAAAHGHFEPSAAARECSVKTNLSRLP